MGQKLSTARALDDYESDDDIQMQLTLLQQAYDKVRQEYEKGRDLVSTSLQTLAKAVLSLEGFIEDSETRLSSIFTRMDGVFSSCHNGVYRLEDLEKALKDDVDKMDEHLCFMAMLEASISEYKLASCLMENPSTPAEENVASDGTNATLQVPATQDLPSPFIELAPLAVHHKALQHLIYERWNSTKNILKSFSTDLIVATMFPLDYQPQLEDLKREGLPPGQFIDLAIEILSQGIVDMQEEVMAAEELLEKFTAGELEKELVNATRHFE